GTNVSPPPTAVSGEHYTVQWTVQNQGTSPTEDAILFDDIYLSDNPVLVPGAAQWYLGTIEHDGVVSAGDAYTAQHTFQLSPEISGKYVIVNTNTGRGSIPPTWEGPNTGNNTNSAASHVTSRPPADLQVAGIVTQPTNFSGEPTSVTWTVKNFGATAWPGTRYWLDDVYFSRYPTLNPQRDTLLGEFPHSNDQPLAAGASYSQSTTFILPRGIGGAAANPQPFYIHVVTN